MNFYQHVNEYLLWAFTLSLECALLWRVHPLRTMLPAFHGLIILKVVRSAALFGIGLTADPLTYFYAYSGLTVVAGLGVFPVIAEVFDFSRQSFRICLLVTLGLSFLAAVHDPVMIQDSITAIVRGIDRATWIAACGMFLWASLIELPVTKLKFGIALGLTVYGAASLIKASLVAYFGFAHFWCIGKITNIVYPLTVSFWLVFTRLQPSGSYTLSNRSLTKLQQELRCRDVMELAARYLRTAAISCD